MLGSGRPFLVEVSNAKILPSSAIVKDIADTINYSKDKFVSKLFFMLVIMHLNF